MISGVDNMIFTTARPERVLTSALRAVRKRWPNVIIGVAERPYREFRGKLRKNESPQDEAEFSVARNEAMVRHWDRHGYALMRDGDGPFAIFYRKRFATNYKLRRVTEPREDPKGMQAPDPYRAMLSCPWIGSFDIVTPEPPEDDPFSQWVYEVFCQACRECED